MPVFALANAGVTLADLSKTIAGPVTVHIPPGSPELDVRIPVNDPQPAATQIEHCTKIPPLAEAGATFSDGACHVSVPSGGYALDFWVEGQEIRIGKKGAAIGSAAMSWPASRPGSCNLVAGSTSSRPEPTGNPRSAGTSATSRVRTARLRFTCSRSTAN